MQGVGNPAAKRIDARIRRDSVCNTFQEPIITSVIDVKKIAAWGESGFPARFLVLQRRFNGPLRESFVSQGLMGQLPDVHLRRKCANSKPRI